MDIDLLSKMVKELILDNDRVVLPGLGSFVAEVVPSTFSDKGYTVNPPYRRLYFRSKPDEGSGLAEFYAATNKVELDVADRIIKDFVKELRSVLHTKKLVVFPGLGRLRATKENNAFFVADEDLDIYPAGFGLEPISLKTHQETPEEVSAALSGLKSILEETVSEVVPELEPEVVPTQAVVPTPVVEPAPAVEPVPESEPVAVEEGIAVESEEMPEEPAAEPVAEDAPVREDRPVEDTIPAVRKERKTIKVVIVLLALVLLLLVAFVVVGRIFPDWIDRFLYTPEELKILNYRL